MTLSRDRGWADFLMLQFIGDRPKSTALLQERLEVLAPHVAKAVEIYRTFHLLQARYSAMLGALDRLGVGVCVADRRARSIVANAEARRIFESQDGLTLDRQGVVVANAENETRALHRAIGACCQTVCGEGETSEITLACSRRSQGTPYLAEVCPLADAGDEIGSAFRGAFICIIDPDDVRHVDASGVATLFGLSPAERAVCDLLLRACSAQEIAEERGVKVETARAQVKSIYAKTGVKNRAELMRRAFTARPPIL